MNRTYLRQEKKMSGRRVSLEAPVVAGKVLCRRAVLCLTTVSSQDAGGDSEVLENCVA